jgi:hypothetical protein
MGLVLRDLLGLGFQGALSPSGAAETGPLR